MLRFAPSPTGDMHIDTLRVAIVNYLVSQQRDEPFIIRIEDRDKAKNIEGKDTEIMQILEKFALKHDNVFHQSEHLHMHQTLAIRLLEEGKAFVCTCGDEKKDTAPYSGHCFNEDRSEHARLKESGTPFVIRIKKPEENIVYDDLIRGETLSTPDEVDSFVILDSEGIPSEDFASACDDMLSGVNFIICAEDNLGDTPRQIHIKKALGYEEETAYAHLPGIMNSDDKKMQQSDETATVKWLFEEGYIPDAVINYLLLLGNTEIPAEIFTLPEAIAWFKLENLSRSEAIFDINKLRFINREHFRMMDDKRLSTLFGFADADIGKLAKLYLGELSTVKELDAIIKAIFSPKDFNGQWGKEMRILEKCILALPMINSFDEFQATLMKESGLEDQHFHTPLRILLTGAEKGPELSDVFPLINPYLLEVAS